jgi:hypothetical protein
MEKVELDSIKTLIKKYATGILRDDASVLSALCCVDKIYFRVSIVYKYKSVVFTDPKTEKQIIKYYN